MQLNKGTGIHTMKDLRLTNESLRAAIAEMQYPPNEMQYAVAQTSLHLSTKYRRQLHVVKGADGKSRIVAALALTALMTTDSTEKQVHVVYSNPVLLAKDKDILLGPLN